MGHFSPKNALFGQKNGQKAQKSLRGLIRLAQTMKLLTQQEDGG